MTLLVNVVLMLFRDVFPKKKKLKQKKQTKKDTKYPEKRLAKQEKSVTNKYIQKAKSF